MTGEECLIWRLVLIHIICRVLVLVVESFFIVSVLVGRSEIVGRMLGFIGIGRLKLVFLLQSWLCKGSGCRGRGRLL